MLRNNIASLRDLFCYVCDGDVLSEITRLVRETTVLRKLELGREGRATGESSLSLDLVRKFVTALKSNASLEDVGGLGRCLDEVEEEEELRIRDQVEVYTR